MALSKKLKADYVELINEKLDHISIRMIEEFDLINEALMHVVTPQTDYLIPEAQREQIMDISDLLNSPEEYVASEDDYAEYQQIIRDRIHAKVLEFQSLSDAQKLAYMKALSERELKAIQFQQQIAGRQAPQPGSDAHTMTEEQWLAEQQAEFSGHHRVSVSAAPGGDVSLSPIIPLLDFNAFNQVLMQLRAWLHSQGSDFSEAQRLVLRLVTQPNRAIRDRSQLHLGTPVQSRSNRSRRSSSPTDFDGRERRARMMESNISSPLNPPLGAARHSDQSERSYAFFRTGQSSTTERDQQQLATEPSERTAAVDLELLSNSIRNNPEDLGARLQRAQLLSSSYDAAMLDYNYILEREPNNVAALLGRARLNEHESIYESASGDALREAALADYRLVLAIDQVNESALSGIERLTPSAPFPRN